ncbi:hypothetical protein [Leptolyngbya sp. GB2-A1]
MKATTYIDFVQTAMQMDRASKLHSFMLEGMNIQGATGRMLFGHVTRKS